MSESLLQAAQVGDLPRVLALLAAGAPCDARSAEGATALMLAAHAGKLDVVRALIAAGADVNATDAQGWGALMKAIYNPTSTGGSPTWCRPSSPPAPRSRPGSPTASAR